MAYGWEIDKIIEKINGCAIEIDWSINDLIDFHNILKYLDIKRFANYIVEQTGIDIKVYEKRLKQKVGLFIGKNKSNFVSLYDDIDFMDTKTFWKFHL
ncbi:hypothetical protein [Paenibacillus sp. YSY-4.3]